MIVIPKIPVIVIPKPPSDSRQHGDPSQRLGIPSRWNHYITCAFCTVTLNEAHQSIITRRDTSTLLFYAHSQSPHYGLYTNVLISTRTWTPTISAYPVPSVQNKHVRHSPLVIQSSSSCQIMYSRHILIQPSVSIAPTMPGIPRMTFGHFAGEFVVTMPAKAIRSVKRLQTTLDEIPGVAEHYSIRVCCPLFRRYDLC